MADFQCSKNFYWETLVKVLIHRNCGVSFDLGFITGRAGKRLTVVYSYILL